jgi:hypothetical protein
MMIWTSGSSLPSGSQNAWTWIKKTLTVPIVWETFVIFSFGAIQTIFCRDWWQWTNLIISLWPGDKATISGVASQQLTRPKKFRVKKPSRYVLAWIFMIKTASLLTIFQRAKLSTRRITHLCWCNWRIFWRKNVACGKVNKGVLARQRCASPDTSNPGETDLPGLQMSWSPNLFSRSGPVGLPPVPWTEKKNNLNVAFFVWQRAHCCRGDLVGRKIFWFSCEWLAEVRATG